VDPAAGSPPRHDLQHTGVDERPDRLADGLAADAQLAGEGALGGQAIAEAEPSEADRLGDPLDHLAHGAARLHGLEGQRHRLYLFAAAVRSRRPWTPERTIMV
jgi:hypothetical protein